MNKRMIGNLINYERNKRKVSVQKLCEGICSASALQRAESGERLPDYFVLERVIERLGVSVNKLEFLQDQEAYEIYYLRVLIEQYLEAGEYEEAERALDYYAKQADKKSGLHHQYMLQIQAVIASQRDRNHLLAKELFEQALMKTVIHFSFENLDDCILGEGEVLLLLLYLQEKMELGEGSLQYDGKRVFTYIERNFQDEEVRVNVYTKAALLLGSAMIRENNRKEALWYTLQGEKILADNGILLHLPQFLDRILMLEKEGSTAYLEWKKQRDALKQLYEEYGQRWEDEGLLLWKRYRQQENYLLQELFMQERKLLKKSQEKLADALDIDQKTISRIESGKYKPKAGTFQKLKEYLDIDRDLCSTRIVTEDFSLLEMEREVAKLGHYRRDREAEKLYEQLKQKLSLEWRENQQYIRYMDTLYGSLAGRISSMEAIEGCMEAFRITRGDIPIERINEVVLSRREATILNYVAICYKDLGDEEKAIDLLQRVVEGYELSKSDTRHHFTALSLIYINLCKCYEKKRRYVEAMDVCNKSIYFSIRCQKGLSIGYMLSKKTYDMDEISGERENSRNRYLQAYQLMKLMKQDKEIESLQKAYKKWYGEDMT